MNRHPEPHVLVGYDGSPASEYALRRGVREARLRRLPLTICHACGGSTRGSPPEPSGEHAEHEIARKMGRHVLDTAVAQARALAPALPVRASLHSGPAGAAILRESAGAAVIAIGAPEAGAEPPAAEPPRPSRGALPSRSTTLQVAVRAGCPTLVVRAPRMGADHIVVGFDGSPASEAGLGFAFEEAALRGQSLRAVYACGPEAVAASAPGAPGTWAGIGSAVSGGADDDGGAPHGVASEGGPDEVAVTEIAPDERAPSGAALDGAGPDEGAPIEAEAGTGAIAPGGDAATFAVRRRTAARIEREVSLWREKYPHVEASAALSFAPAAQALLDAAAGAGLLVVAGRAYGPTAVPLLGSTARYVLRHAPCTVAIVPSRVP